MAKSRIRGFTLIEVMIVVAIVGILAAIALPAYQDQVRKSRRASAEAHLMDIASRQQQFLLDNRRYATNLATLTVTTPTEVSNYYTVSCCEPTGGGATNGTPPQFLASAAPKSNQSADLAGATLSIDNAGTKLPALYGGHPVW
jgi:type IV pilus assembly protein PilE